MINVDILEDNGLTALCTIEVEANDEFQSDLERIKKVPWYDREFVESAEPKYWRVKHAENYRDLVVEIGDAIKLYEMQLRMF